MSMRVAMSWMGGKGYWLVPALLALVIQLAYLAEGPKDPTFRTPVIDAGQNHREALMIASGEPLPATPYWQPPLYPYVLAGIYRVAGRSIPAAKLFQALMGAASCALLAGIGARAFDRRVGLIAGLLLAVSGPFIFYNLQLLATGLSLFLDLLALLLALRALERPGIGRWLLCGLAFGLSALALPNLLIFEAALVLWMIFAYGMRERSWGRALARAGVLIAATLVVIAPVTIRNATVSGRFVPISYNGGYNLWIGNNPHADATTAARPGFQSDRLLALPHLDGLIEPTATQRWFLSKTWDYVRTQPGSFMAGLARKAALFVNAREVPRNEDPYEYRDYSVLLKILMWRLGSFGFPFGIILPLAVVGIAAGGARSGPRRWVLVFTILYALSVIAFFVSSRHRLPVAALLGIYAAAGAVWLVARVREGTRRQAAAGLAGLLAAGVLVNLPVAAPTDGVDLRAETLSSLGSDAAMTGRFGVADRFYQRSIARAPGVSETHTRLGGVYESSRLKDRAMAEYQKAVELDPGAAEAYLRIGAMLSDRGNDAAALESYRKSVAAWPAYVDGRYALADAMATAGEEGWIDQYRAAWRLEHGDSVPMPEPGRLLLDRGRTAAALTYYRGLTKDHPDDPGARLGLARSLTQIAFERGLSSWGTELNEAIETCRALVAADPGNIEARRTLANALFGAGRKDEAMAAFTEALRLADGNARLHTDFAKLLESMNDDDRAERELKRAIELDGRLADAHQELGALYQRHGDVARALPHLRRAAMLKTAPAGSSAAGSRNP